MLSSQPLAHQNLYQTLKIGGGQDTLTQDETKGKSLKSNPSALDSHTSLPALQAKIHHFTKYANIKPLLCALVESTQTNHASSAWRDETEFVLESRPSICACATAACYESKPIVFHLIADTLKPATLERLRTLESTLSKIYPTTITIHQQSQQEFIERNPIGEAGANWCAYFRLKIGEILPQSARRCLYLDTDTLVLGDVREMFYHDLGDNAIGAVRDIIARDTSCFVVRDGLVSAHEYCNSGVLLIDLPKWRTKDLAKIHDFPYRQTADQDFINVTFKGEITLLSYHWNFQWFEPRRLHFLPTPKRFSQGGHIIYPCAHCFSEFASALLRPAIVHLLGGYKPWEKSNFQADPSKPPIFVQNPYHKLWWKIAAQSPFATKLRLAYAKRASRIWLSCYLLAYAPTLYAVLRMMKRAVKTLLPKSKKH
ncbi:glycosyltransferase family 8 protein [Helicobacter sp.]|uniref:glycosyltransferase family 8 protein n=1 Tax=Helicobacter sp. TaxID=218 RepID=UPI0038902107